MAIPVLPAIISAVAGFLFRRGRSDNGGDARPEAPRRAPSLVFLYLLAFLLIWFFVVHPVLSYHYPEYNFPGISPEVLGAVFAALGG